VVACPKTLEAREIGGLKMRDSKNLDFGTSRCNLHGKAQRIP